MLILIGRNWPGYHCPRLPGTPLAGQGAHALTHAFAVCRPRVAVCLRGTLRYYRQAHASLVRNVIDVNPQYAFDVFIMSRCDNMICCPVHHRGSDLLSAKLLPHTSLLRMHVINPSTEFDTHKRARHSVYVDGNSKQQGPHPCDTPSLVS